MPCMLSAIVLPLSGFPWLAVISINQMFYVHYISPVKRPFNYSACLAVQWHSTQSQSMNIHGHDGPGVTYTALTCLCHTTPTTACDLVYGHYFKHRLLTCLFTLSSDKISVLWNNCFRHIFRCCWRESVRPLQYYCRTLPMLHLVNQTKLLWKKMYTNSNVVLYTLSRYAGVPSRFMAVASQYGIHSLRQTVGTWELSSLLSGSLLQRLFISRCAYFVLMLYCTFVCVCVSYVCFMFALCRYLLV